MSNDILLYLHVIGAMVLFGTGAGIAFFMVQSNRSGDPALIAHVAGIVVIADTIFTATAAVAQPVTGYLLARQAFGGPAEMAELYGKYLDGSGQPAALDLSQSSQDVVIRVAPKE